MPQQAILRINNLPVRTRLFLPGRIISAEYDPHRQDVVFLLESGDFPESPEDALPEIDIEVDVIEDWNKPGETHEAYWVKDNERHRIK